MREGRRSRRGPAGNRGCWLDLAVADCACSRRRAPMQALWRGRSASGLHRFHWGLRSLGCAAGPLRRRPARVSPSCRHHHLVNQGGAAANAEPLGSFMGSGELGAALPPPPRPQQQQQQQQQPPRPYSPQPVTGALLLLLAVVELLATLAPTANAPTAVAAAKATSAASLRSCCAASSSTATAAADCRCPITRHTIDAAVFHQSKCPATCRHVCRHLSTGEMSMRKALETNTEEIRCRSRGRSTAGWAQGR